MLRDVRQRVRALRRSPAFALTTLCTFALAIGTTAAVFSVVDPVLLQPLPIADPDRVVVIWPRERANPAAIGEVSHWTFRSWQQDARSFETLAVIGSVNWGMVLRGDGDPATLPVAAVSASFFPLLGASAALGRTILPPDDERGAGRVVVLSHGSWIRRFGADPGIIGRRLMLGGDAYSVVGVMPEGFDYPRGAELWTPVVPALAAASTPDLDTLAEPGFGVLFLLGRVGPGISFESARDEVSALIARGAGREFAADVEAVLTPLRDHLFGRTRLALVAIAAGVGLLWLIACVNIAALLLVRAVAHRHETAILAAVGATRSHLWRRALIDALILSTLGGAIGLLLGRTIVNGLLALAPPNVPRLDTVAFGARTIIFAGMLSLATGLLAGAVSTLSASRHAIGDALKASAARTRRSQEWRRGFVVVQVAVAMMLIVGAGLVVRSFANLLNLNLGFNPSRVLTLDVLMPNEAPERRAAFYTALLERVRNVPGVAAAGAISIRPLEHAGIGSDGRILLEGQRTDPEYRDWEQNGLVNDETITPDYFQAIGTRLLRGRAFTETDTPGAPRVVIVSDALARRLWPGQDPLGRRLLQIDAVPDPLGAIPWSTVVGVVESVRFRGLTDPRFDLYTPYRQRPDDAVKHLMVRATVDPLTLVGTIRGVARDLDPTVLIEGVRPMEGVVDQATAPWRLSATSLALVGAIAVILATLGVYGIVTESVLERKREIAIRSALGAMPREIVRLAIGEGLLLVVVGMAAGLAAAAGMTRFLGGLLVDVQPLDPATLAATSLLLVFVSAVALMLPLARALRIDIARVLRQEYAPGRSGDRFALRIDAPAAAARRASVVLHRTDANAGADVLGGARRALANPEDGFLVARRFALPEREHVLDCTYEIVGHGRPRQPRAAADLPAGVRIDARDIPSENDDRNMSERALGFQVPAQLPAGHVRQSQVDHHAVRFAVRGETHRCITGVRLHDVIPTCTQSSGVQILVIGNVVDEKNHARLRHSRLHPNRPAQSAGLCGSLARSVAALVPSLPQPCWPVAALLLLDEGHG